MKNKKIQGLLGWTLFIVNLIGEKVLFLLVGNYIATNLSKRIRWIRISIGAALVSITIRFLLLLIARLFSDEGKKTIVVLWEFSYTIILGLSIILAFEWIKNRLNEQY